MANDTHPDDNGAARVVESDRSAIAEAIVVLTEETFEAVTSGEISDVAAAARIAGIMAAKKTPDLVPYSYAASPAKIDIAFENLPERHAIRITAAVKAAARNGGETEALLAAGVAALTIFDMTGRDTETVIETVRLVTKPASKASHALPPPRPVRKTPVATSFARPTAQPSEVVVAAKPSTGSPGDKARTAFRNFMAARHLHATGWAAAANVPATLLYAFLTGRLQTLPDDVIEKLARAARARPEDIFR